MKKVESAGTASIMKAGLTGEFWEVLKSYLLHERQGLCASILGKEWKGRKLSEEEVDVLRAHLKFVDWHLDLPRLLAESVSSEEDPPEFDPYPKE